MSISKLRSRRGVLARQEHVKSPTGVGEDFSASASEGAATSAAVAAGVSRASVVATIIAAENAEDACKTAIKQTAAAANAKLLNAAALNAAVVAAATVATVTAKQQQQHQSNQLPQTATTAATAQTNLPQTSLLKIEPFVPSLTTRLRRRPFGRSYTTLNGTTTIKSTTIADSNNKRKTNKNIPATTLNSPLLGAAIDSQRVKANAASTRAAVAARLRRNPVRALVKRQRSKSTSSSASNRPVTAHRLLSPCVPHDSEAAGDFNGGGDCASATSSASGNGNGSSNSNATATTASVTLQPNGICRIIRCAEEREKQPDRINYDRRGLSAIPIFEQETQLRLLSLQHNLINIFHIPKAEQAVAAPPEAPALLPSSSPQQTAALAVIATQAEVSRRSPDLQSELVGKSEHSALRQQNERVAVERIAEISNGTSGACMSAGASLAVNAGQRLSLALSTTPARQLHNNSLTPPPPPPTPHGQLQSTLPHAAAPPSPQIYQQLLQQRFGAIANNNAVKNLHYNAPLLPLTRQAPPSRFALKRSKSFLTNIPRHLHSIQQNMLKTQMVRARLAAASGGTDAARLKSFDSSASALTTNSTDSSTLTATTTNTYDSTKTINSTGTTFVGSAYDDEADDPLQQLAVKNLQLMASYGMIFQHLVFLDLYDNQIERIGNLDGLPALSVLLLGKNRISDISGLASLKQTLRVLDLHGNKITSISSKLNCLHELKSLNLAGNLLRQIGANDFYGLEQLRELNLKRNKIKRIQGFQHLSALERLWLCHNELHRVDDMSSIATATNLLEITIDNNPVSLAGDCVSFLVSYLPRLQMLTQMPITEQVRVAAMSWRRNKEISDTHYAHLTPDAYQSIKREEVISNARTNWELLRSQQMLSKQTAAPKQQLTTIPTPRNAKQRELSRINESNEAAGEVAEASGAGHLVNNLGEHVKLPPIQRTEDKQNQQARHNETHRMPKSNALVKEIESPQAQTVSNGTHADNSSNNERFSGSSGSSLNPNVHSSSSCFSSDNEDSTELRLQQQGARIHKFQKSLSQQQRCGGVGGDERGNKNKLRTKKCTTTEISDTRRTNDASEANMGAGAHKVNSVTETTNTLATTEGSMLNANGVTTKQTTNDTNPTDSDTTVQPQLEEFMNANDTAENASGDTISPVIDNNSSILMPSRRTAANSSSKTNVPQTKLTSTTDSAQVGSAPTTTKQIANQASSSILSLSSPTLQLPSPQQTNNLGGDVPAMGRLSARTTCRRLMRMQTVVSAINNCSTTATATANSGSEGAVGGVGSRRATNNHNKTSQAGALQQPTVTCIVAPTPLNNANSSNGSNSSGGSSLLLGGQQRATVASKAERDARERDKEREREREQGGDYLIEICGRYLNVYGQGALRYIDKQWNAAKAQDVHTLNFSYINFNNIAATVLARIKTRFPNAENFVFRETNIEYIGQLNALAELQGIGSLTIDPEGNAITTKDLWREYAIYRLSHWGLKLINGVAVTEAEIETANGMFESLADLVLWAMPATMLQPLLARLRLDETCTASKMSPKEWLMKPENKSLRLVVGKEALQWKKPTTSTSGHSSNNNNNSTNNNNGNGINSQHQQPMPYPVSASSARINANTNMNALSMRERGRLHFATMLENTLNAVEKLHMLESLWPSMLLDIVRNALLDYSHLDEYLRTVMEEIMK